MLSRKNFDFLEPLKRYLRHTGRFVYTIIAGYSHHNTQYFVVTPSPLKPNFMACPTPQILQFPTPPLPLPLSNKTERPLKGDLHGMTFPHAASLRQVYDMTLDHLHANASGRFMYTRFLLYSWHKLAACEKVVPDDPSPILQLILDPVILKLRICSIYRKSPQSRKF